MRSIKQASGAGNVRYRVRISRCGEARHLTHLAQIEALRRAVAASGLPGVVDRRKKRPKPRLAFGPAISMGYESRAEYFDLELETAVTPEEVTGALASVLSGGFTVIGVRRIPKFFPSLDASINVVRYEIRGEFPRDSADRLASLLARREIVIEKVKKGGARVERVDARPLIREMVLASPGHVTLTLRFGPKRTVKPEALLREWLGGLPGELHIMRQDLFSETSGGELISP
ncbi:TIGR03936 family radical SAM-associated protein [Elusimicrobiota bacterium]